MEQFNLDMVYLLFLIIFIVLAIVFSRLNKLEEKFNSYEKLQKKSPLKKSEEKILTEEKILEEPIIEKIDKKPIEIKPIPNEPVFVKEIINKKADSQEKSSFEKFFADNILNKVGAVALILGLGFFLKYAFDNNWINEFAQLAIGYLVSIGIFITGIKLQEKTKLSQSLLGVGCAALFLTTYAGYSYYHIIPNILAIILMSVVSIFTIITSMHYNSLAIAFLGLFGGYITPVMMGSSQNVIGFLSYILFLNIILAYVAYKKDWIQLQATGFFANLLWLTIFIQSNRQALDLVIVPSGILIVAIWFVHFIVDILKNQDNEIISKNRFINPFFAYVILFNLIKTPQSIGLVAILFAVIYLLTMFKKDIVFYKHNIIIGLIFILLGILKLTDGYNTMGCLIAYATIIMAIGAVKDKDYLLNTGASFLTFSFAKLFFMENALMFKDISAYNLLLSPRSYCFEAIAIIGFGFGYYLDKIKNNNAIAINVLNFLGATSLFTLLTVEINDYSMSLSSNNSQLSNLDITNIKNIIYIITWSIYSLFFIKVSKRSCVFKVFGYSIYALTLFFLLENGFNAVPSALAVFNIRVIAWLLFIGVTCLAAKWNNEIKVPFTYIALLLGTLLIYSETTIFLPDMSIKQLILSSSWLIYAISLISIGIWKNLKPQRYFAIGLILLVIIKIFFFDLTFLAQMHRIISFMVLGGLLLLTSYLYQKYAKDIK